MLRFDRRRFFALGVAVLAGLALSPTTRRGLASRWSVPAPPIPDTAAGEHLAWALSRVNDPSEDVSSAELSRRFSPDFLAALPAKDLRGVFTTYLRPNGPMTPARFEGAVTETLAKAILVTPGSDWRVTIGAPATDPDKIDQLFFEPVVLPPPFSKPLKSWTPIEKRFLKTAPSVSVLVSELVNGEPIPVYQLNPERSLAIGSAFKLYVLAELCRQIDAGQAAWDEPLAIRDDLRSLPNGQMRLEPAGATYPLQHFAEQMISASDNTATDHLIDRLGRERVETAFQTFGNAQPERNVPLLLTREWFALKLRYSPAQIGRYLKMDVDGKRAELAGRVRREAATLSELEDWSGTYFVEEIEWFASAADLTRVLAHLYRTATQGPPSPVLPALSMNPGIAFDARTWAYVGYKGGYETGVTSSVWLLQRGDGRWFSIAAIINNPEQEADAALLYQTMMPVTTLLAALD